MFGHEILYWLFREEMIEVHNGIFYSHIRKGFLFIACMTVVECPLRWEMKIVDWMASGSNDIKGCNDQRFV